MFDYISHGHTFYNALAFEQNLEENLFDVRDRLKDDRLIAQQGRVFKVIENVEKCGNKHINRHNDSSFPPPLPGFFSFRQIARIRDKIIKEGISTSGTMPLDIMSISTRQ